MTATPSFLTEPLLEASGNWGNYSISSGSPSIINEDDSVYLPWSALNDWGILKENACALELSQEEYIYCGYFNAHFGHLIIDTLSRLWDIENRGAVKLLFHSNEQPEQWFSRGYVADIFSSLKVGIRDVAVLKEKTRLRNLRIVHTSMREQKYIYPVLGEFCREIGRRIWTTEEEPSRGNIVYLSRSRLAVGTANFINENEMELALARLGADVIYPECLPIREQVARIYNAKCIIGIAGSALHTTAFCGNKSIVGISAGNLVNSNFRMIDAVSGNNAVYVYPRNLERVPTPLGFHGAWKIEDPEATAFALIALAETISSSSRVRSDVSVSHG